MLTPPPPPPKKNLMDRIDYCFSIMWISPKKFICLLGKLRTEFTTPMRKSTSPELLDTTCFARWSDLKLLCMYQLLFALNIFKTAFFNNTVETRNFENKFLKKLVNFVLVNYFQIHLKKFFSNVLHGLQPKEGYFFQHLYLSSTSNNLKVQF